ncbi:MAG: class I SAM-dependent methyltransferase [Phycisphaerales bacterium]|nr:class I SAM-dependent methyltransferase [Phycisphaerales bacterium]
MDIREYNRTAWNAQVAQNNQWTIPVDHATVERARQGQWDVRLTPTIPVPRDWFPDLKDCDTLALASGGGQQGPILAAAGARVTVFDNSERQLGQDRLVAEREGLDIKTVQGDMADLGVFDDGSFDFIFHPCSNCFVEDIIPVWRECHRVLRPGGVLHVGFTNPAVFIFDSPLMEKGELLIKNKLPYSDLTDLTPQERQAFIDQSEPLWFGHTLDDQIGAQLSAGFVMTALFEDRDPTNPLSQYMPTYIATRCVKCS